MKRRSYILLVLTIIALATVLFMKRPREVAETSYALPDWTLPVDTSHVVKISVSKGSSSMVIDRARGIWRHKLGDRSVADKATVNRLLEGVANFRLLGLVSSNPRKQDLFEVGEAGTSVALGMDNGKEISLVVGKMSSLPARSYIRPASSDMVFLATGLTPDVFSEESIGGYRQTSFRLDTTSILSIAVSANQTAFTTRKQGRLWVAGQNQIPSDIMTPVLSSLHEISAVSASGVDIGQADRPLLNLDIQERKRVKLEFFANPLNSTTYVMKTSQSPRLFTIGSGTAQPFFLLIGYVNSQQAIASRRPVETEPPQRSLVAEPRPLPPSPAVASSGRRPVVESPLSRTGRQPAVSRSDFGNQTPSQPPPAIQQSIPEQSAQRTSSAKSGTEEDVLTVHTVKPGETLDSIARMYGVSRDQVKQWNLLTVDVVSPGTELYVFVKK